MNPSIHYKYFNYGLDENVIYNLLEKPFEKFKIPELFKVEEVWDQSKVSAPFAPRAFGNGGWYYGVINNKDYLLFKCSSDKTDCQVFLFQRFYPHKIEWRQSFTSSFIRFYQSEIF